MRIIIPKLGDTLTLLEPWTLTIKNERRNAAVAKLLGYESPTGRYPLGAEESDRIHYTSVRWEANIRHEKPGFQQNYRPTVASVEWTLPAGTKLIVDRIYIRKGNAAYDSVTFVTHLYGKRLRFFASLSDVNNMVVEDCE